MTRTRAGSGRAVVVAVALFAALATPVPAGATSPFVPVPAPQYVTYDRYPTGSWPKAVAVADFTGDGLNDVALATSYYFDQPNDFKVFLFAQTGAGVLVQRNKLDTHLATNSDFVSLTAADIDADGDKDLLLTTGQGIDIFQQFLGGLLTARLVPTGFTGDVDVVDVTGDGVVDLVAGTGSGVLLLAGTGGGQFAPPVAITPYQFQELEVADVSGDGIRDLVGYTGTEVVVLRGVGNGTFGAPATYPLVLGYWPNGNGLAVADLNGDGRNDVAVTISGNRPGARFNVFYQNILGTLAPAQAILTYDSPEPLVAADVNQDGRADLVTIHGGWNAVGISTQLPGGGLSGQQLIGIPYASHYANGGLDVGDVNGDGAPDLVIADSDNGLVVVRSASQLQAWGLGNAGQLGNGATLDLSIPTPPLALGPVATAAAGAYHNLAVTRDGRVWTWGLNNAGQLGDGTAVARTTPVRLKAPTGVVNVSGGAVHSAAVGSDGTLWTWGWNHFGQLGLGDTTDRNVPTKVGGISGVVAVAAGLAHTLALTADGSVWAWGLNHAGQLGTGSVESSAIPLRLNGISGVVAIAAGAFHSLALTRDGRVYGWGLNTSGQLGLDPPVPAFIPSQPSVPFALTPQPSQMTNAGAIAAGAYHSVALGSNGTVWSWGLNTEGELGGSAFALRPYPDRVYLDNVRTIASGWFHSLAVTWGGQAYAWGWNYFGQLGDGTTTNALQPVAVETVDNALVGAGIAHSFALTARGAEAPGP